MVMSVEEKKLAKKLRAAKYYIANKERIDLLQKKYREENKTKVRKFKLAYKFNNKSKISITNAKYALENKEKFSAKTANRRAKKFGATIYMTKEDKAKIAELYTIAKYASKLFGYGWEVDHIVPLNKGGLHKLSNLQVVPMSWNRAKGDRNCDTYWD